MKLVKNLSETKRILWDWCLRKQTNKNLNYSIRTILYPWIHGTQKGKSKLPTEVNLFLCVCCVCIYFIYIYIYTHTYIYLYLYYTYICVYIIYITFLLQTQSLQWVNRGKQAISHWRWYLKYIYILFFVQGNNFKGELAEASMTIRY